MGREREAGLIIQFRNTRISQFNTAIKEGGPICRLHLRCDLSRPVAEQMGWEIMVEENGILCGIDSADLEGKVQAASVKLIPNGDLKNQQIEFVGFEAKDFKVKTAGGGEGDDDPPLSTELRFILTFAPEAAANVLKYYLIVGSEAALMKVTVAKEQQMKLGEDAEDGDEEPAEESPEEPQGPALASAREVRASVRKR